MEKVTFNSEKNPLFKQKSTPKKYQNILNNVKYLP